MDNQTADPILETIKKAREQFAKTKAVFDEHPENFRTYYSDRLGRVTIPEN